MAIENKAPGKDIAPDDLNSKFPLAAKKSPDHVSRFKVAGIEFGGPLVPVMAGPNTVENEEMIVATAMAVKAAGGHILRGGAFKPLSFPYRGPKYFETREKGLEWLAKARAKTGLPITTPASGASRRDLKKSRSPTSTAPGVTTPLPCIPRPWTSVMRRLTIAGKCF